MQDLKGFIFDLDGTVYLGDTLIPGAKETLELLRQRNKQILFLTNYPLETRLSKVHKLEKLGIRANMQEVLSSVYVLVNYLTQIHPNAKVLPIAEQVLIEKLEDDGHIITYDPAEVEYVVISWDRGFNYHKLNLALQSVRNGAKMIASNPDRTCPVEGGVVPDAAGMIGAIEGVTGKKVELIAGKPSFIMSEIALKTLQLRPEECIIIGDRIETDILMGKQAGMKTAWVRTGASRQEDIATQKIYPDYQLDSIANIQQFIE